MITAGSPQVVTSVTAGFSRGQSWEDEQVEHVATGHTSLAEKEVRAIHEDRLTRSVSHRDSEESATRMRVPSGSHTLAPWQPMT